MRNDVEVKKLEASGGRRRRVQNEGSKNAKDRCNFLGVAGFIDYRPTGKQYAGNQDGVLSAVKWMINWML